MLKWQAKSSVEVRRSVGECHQCSGQSRTLSQTRSVAKSLLGSRPDTNQSIQAERPRESPTLAGTFECQETQTSFRRLVGLLLATHNARKRVHHTPPHAEPNHAYACTVSRTVPSHECVEPTRTDFENLQVKTTVARHPSWIRHKAFSLPTLSSYHIPTPLQASLWGRSTKVGSLGVSESSVAIYESFLFSVATVSPKACMDCIHLHVAS